MKIAPYSVEITNKRCLLILNRSASFIFWEVSTFSEKMAKNRLISPLGSAPVQETLDPSLITSEFNY